MGKGSGTCTDRAAILMGDDGQEIASEVTPSALVAPLSPEELRDRLWEAKSYPEVLALLHGDLAEHMEPQRLNEIAQDVMNYHAQMRAIFVEESLFQDHLLYVEYKHLLREDGGAWNKDAKPSFQHLAEVPTGARERQLIRGLIDAGAKIEINELEAPVPNPHPNKPAGQFGMGQRFSLYEDGKSLHYVPHFSVGTEYNDIYRHRGAFTVDQANLDRALDRMAAFKEINPEEIVRIKSDMHGEARYSYRSLASYSDGEREEIMQAIASGTSRSVKQRDGIINEEYRFLKSEEKTSKKIFHTHTLEEKDEATGEVTQREATTLRSEWNQYEKAAASLKSLANRVAKGENVGGAGPRRRRGAVAEIPESAGKESRSAKLASKKGQPVTVIDDDASDELLAGFDENGEAVTESEREHTKNFKKQAKTATAATLRFDWTSKHEQLENGANRGALGRKLSESLGNRRGGRYAADLLVAMERDIEHGFHRDMKRKFVEHDAPASERGVLKLRGYSPQEAIDKLKGFGAITGVCEQVPYQTAYRSHRRRGRVLPLHADYATATDEKTKRLPIPNNQMIIHGMTGIAGASEAVKRLDTIVQSGGLASLAERRRMGLSFATVDPHQDTASRLDLGVPACITNAPWAGASVYFGLRPETLKRRDVWFSNQCPVGTGEMQRQQYKAYAEQIGQKSPHTPPSHQSRMTHLQGGLQTYNEVYLKHEVPMEEIDTIFVENGMYSKVVRAMKKWKKQGFITEDIRIAAFTPDGSVKPPIGLPPVTTSTDLRQAIQKRAKELHS